MTLASIIIAGKSLEKKGRVRGKKECFPGHSHQNESLEFNFFDHPSFSQSNREE